MNESELIELENLAKRKGNFLTGGRPFDPNDLSEDARVIVIEVPRLCAEIRQLRAQLACQGGI